LFAKFAARLLALTRRAPQNNRDVLIDVILEPDWLIESNTLDTFMKLLRQKVDNDNEPKLLYTSLARLDSARDPAISICNCGTTSTEDRE
jgi:DNA-binding response OmpR family regulator